jgi:hypothetical protein
VTRVRVPALLVLGGTLVLAVSGCGTPEPAPGPSNFAEYAQAVLDDARASGASEAQLAILERAVATGEISFEDASVANDATIECLVDAGFTVSAQVDETVPGFPVPGFTAGRPTSMTEDQGDASLSSCESRENFFVNMMYQTQPAADEAKWANFERVKTEFIACLQDAGLSVPGDATNDELVDLALDLAFDESSPNPVNCLHEVGIDSI